MKISCILTLFLYINIAVAQQNINIKSFLEDPNAQVADMAVDIDNISANISIDPYQQIVKGVAKIKFKTLRVTTDSLVFTTPEMVFNSVSIGNNRVKFEKKGNLTILYPESNSLGYLIDYELIIDYTAHPTSDLFFSGWNDKTNRKRKQIWAHSPSRWLPFINQKQDLLKTELFVTFDKNYKVSSNGDRISVKDNNNGSLTWHYKLDKPHVVYLICLVIGDYEWVERKSKDGTPIELWYYPDQKDRIETTYRYMEKMVDFLEAETNIKYPWGQYRQAPVTDYLYGAMETTTATIFGDYMFVDERAWWMRNYVNVNVHELTHQWFGNLVSHLPPNVWLTESFATYYAKMFEQSVFGNDYYQWERKKELDRVLDAAKKNNIPVSSSLAGSDRWYPKGSLILDMLRDLIGDKEFKTAINYYISQNYHKVTNTSDFIRAVRESTGFAIDWFVEQWILRGGEPKFKVEYELISKANNNILQAKIEQIQKIDELIKVFKVPINIDVYFQDKSKITYKNWINDKITTFDIELPKGKIFDFMVFDPNRKIIKTVDFERAYNELASQSLNATNMIDRYDALLALREFSIAQKRGLLLSVYSNENYHLTKGEAIFQLLNDSLSYPIIAKAINDGDELVTRCIVENLKVVPDKLAADYRKILKDSCYTNVEKALENLTYSLPENDYLKETENEIGWRGKNIRIKWLELALTKNINQSTLLNELIDYTSQSFEFETRMNAIRTLKHLNYLDRTALNNIVDSYNFWNNKLKPLALDALKYFYQQNQYYVMINTALRESKQQLLLEQLD
ncbi:MAG TPA: M1 family metallopeptidase [Candidatus Kapabacteria bacterium]|nr:M1 family metallopeptidase [Candidatus Kapabacteria bacterium]